MKLLVLDGNSILNRAFYGIKLLTTKEGVFTNGIYGFLTMLNRLRAETSPDAVAIAFDMRAPTFRHKKYAGYKAQRKGMPEELAQQMPRLKELLRLLGYRLVECEGYEADDILGTFARICRETGNECVLATGDRDSLQLVGGTVTVRLATTKMGQPLSTIYDEAKIMEDYGVTPPQMIDIKALQGDSSDNIPGVAGIGPKGAGDLVQRYHDLDNIYDNLASLDIKEGMRKKLEAGRESAYLSRWLGTICTEAPINGRLEDYIPAPCDAEGASRMMARLEFFSLIDKMGLRAPAEGSPLQAAKKKEAARVLTDPDEEALLSSLKKAGRADFTAAFKDGKNAAENGKIAALFFRMGDKAAVARGQELYGPLFADASIQKNTCDSKALYAALEREGLPLRGECFDTGLAAYLLNPSASGYEPDRLAQEYHVEIPDLILPEEEADVRAEGTTRAQKTEQKRKLAEKEAKLALLRAALFLPALADRLREKVEENGQTALLQKIELPLARVLARMETIGFAVDADGIAAYGEILQARTDELQAEIYQAVGYEFNINSPKQLGEALFEKLGLAHGKKTKTGYSTDAKVLETLRYEHSAVDLILDYRTVSKLKSTYCEGLLKVIAEDGRIHSSFNQMETRTGRISSTEPNLQNIPVRTDLGREFRRFFTAKEGCVLVDADYSQIELRVLAHVAEDESMIRAFREGDDIHRITAAQVFHMPEDMVTPLMRSRAKAVNFGIVYGIGAFSLSKNIGVTNREAQQYIDDYLAHYAGVANYMKRVVVEAKEKGYVETLFGRRRYLPELTSSNFNLRSFGERVARNMPIQGTAADIIKISMIRVEDRLQREHMKSRLILQVHDELIVEAPEDEAEQAARILTEEMQGAVDFAVPMIAEANIGKTWYDAKG